MVSRSNAFVPVFLQERKLFCIFACVHCALNLFKIYKNNKCTFQENSGIILKELCMKKGDTSMSEKSTFYLVREDPLPEAIKKTKKTVTIRPV